MLKPSLFMASALCGVLAAKTAVAVMNYADTTFSGNYVIYGGYPAPQEARAPTPGDMKVAFSIRGAAAKGLYDAIGPGGADRAPAQTACSNNPKITVRQRDTLICRRSAQDGYWCTFGFDLSTGLSTWGVIGGQICGLQSDQQN